MTPNVFSPPLRGDFFMRKTNKLVVSLLSTLSLSLACSPVPASTSSITSVKSSFENSPSNQTYTGAIKDLANKAKGIVDSGIKEFNNETLPHQAKDLRKQIVRLRDILDVYSHNFSHELNLWDDVRDDLDDGYTVVGDFKDLFDTNQEAVRALENGGQPEYKDKKKLNERREKVLAWKKQYFAEGGLSEKIWVLFLDIHELDSNNLVNSKKYSDFFWGGVTAQPLASASPAQNARRLIDAQADLAVHEHPAVLEMKDPSSEKNEIIFHDHRKRLRTIVKVCNVANSLTPETCATDAVKEIESLVVDLGAIEDLIITGRHLEDDGKKNKAEDAYEDAKKKFKKLKSKFEGKNMIEALERL